MENTTTFIKYLYKVLLAFCLLLVVISCEGDNGCTNETVISTQDVDMNHPDFLEIIEGYNATYNNTSKASNNQIKTNVFVDRFKMGSISQHRNTLHR